jgi:hypothetical protein
MTRAIFTRALNLPLLLAVLLMMTAFGRLNLWLPLCLGRACDALQSGPGMLPLLCSIGCISLLSFERTPQSWQASHWTYHRRTLVMGALAATALMGSMIASGDVPIELLAGIPISVPQPSLFFLAGLALLTTWLLARCIVSAHAASGCRPLPNAVSYLW